MTHARHSGRPVERIEERSRVLIAKMPTHLFNTVDTEGCLLIGKRKDFTAQHRIGKAAASEQETDSSEDHKDAYGSPRMHLELVTRGYEICETTVAKLMQREDLAALTEKRFRVRTTDSNHSLPVAENTVD